MIKDRRHLLSVFILYLLSFFILMEWIWPLQLLTDTNSAYFVIFAGLCFILSYFQIHFLISAIIKILYILYTYHSLFYQETAINIDWFKNIFNNMLENINLMISGDWWSLTGGFRSFLFFSLLWIIIYLIHYWLFTKKQIFFLLFLTILYVTILDTFTPYQADSAIVRLVFLGVLLVSLLYLTRIKQYEKIGSGITAKWIIPVAILLLSTMSAAFLAPKGAPYLPDPVPYLQSYVEGPDNGSGVQRVGYGTNDSHLGGPFIQDNKTVFITETKKEHYWRVETKDFYTGKGWKASYKAEEMPISKEYIPLNLTEDSVKTTSLVDNLKFSILYPHLVYPVGLSYIDTHQPVRFTVNPLTEKISTYSVDDQGKTRLSSYSVKYEYPSYSINALESVHLENEAVLDPSFLGLYTQLPITVPKRVFQLAEEITGDKTNLYSKVKAVESYFKMNSYVYNIENVAVPGKEEDYVDQFLFDTKKGYCDNFSSSMVVLLRAENIPARWVKGYTQGEHLEDVGNSIKKYKITNNHAHSWVEVYFPKTGWVPFEPTIGFSNPSDFEYKLDESGQAQQTLAPVQKDLSKLEKDKELKQNQNLNNQNDPFSLKSIWEKLSWKGILLLVFLLMMVTYVIVKIKPKWSPKLIILKYKFRKDEKVFFQAYLALLKQLESMGIKRKNGQTLREFAAYVDKYYDMNKMGKLTYKYEKALYRHTDAAQEWKESIELWENLIKKVSS